LLSNVTNGHIDAMILKRLYDPKLAQASYLVGCGATGEAVVFDPNRDIDQYLRAAAAESLRITHVTETHIHADFVSGSRELAQRAGALLLLSDEGDANWKYQFAAESRAELLHHGSVFFVGNIRIEVIHTPGHTPEHIVFLITDTAAATVPIGMISGDFVFVGDVGRPDLLEKAAHVKGTMDQAARTLFRSLQQFKQQPDYLQIWPGHGAGSACGKGLSAIPHSTVGYERLFNWAFSINDEEEFIHQVLAGQPDPPRYFAEMKRINRDGPSILNGFARPQLMAPTRLVEILGQATSIIDTRPASEYAAGHVPGTVNIPLNKSFNTWAGWLIPYDREIYLIVNDRESQDKVAEAVKDLAMIGLDRVAGYFNLAAVQAWAERDGGLAAIAQVPVKDLAELMEEGAALIDVRAESEWEAGHIPGARHIPLGHLTEHVSELPTDRPIVLQCQSGARSSIGASLLRARGFTQVANLVGGYAAWEKEWDKVKAG
jgi:hydroxyacylglutathione hydrolase